jgi:outer membrane protein
LRAQDSVTGALAELGRAIGSDQSANYQLTDEPLPQAPPATAASLVAQAIDNRPELASLRATRESTYKFFDAERDLTRPTVSAIAVGGYMPYINEAGIPSEYEGLAANVSIPIFNGHLFSARREAAYQHALESAATLAWLGLALMMPTSASTSPRSFCVRRPWPCNWRRDGTI